MNERGLKSDIARESTDEQLIALLLLRQGSLGSVKEGNPHRETILEAKHSAECELLYRLKVAGEATAKAQRCLGFFASVIKSGESWTDTCQREYEAAIEPQTAAKDV